MRTHALVKPQRTVVCIRLNLVALLLMILLNQLDQTKRQAFQRDLTWKRTYHWQKWRGWRPVALLWSTSSLVSNSDEYLIHLLLNFYSLFLDYLRMHFYLLSLFLICFVVVFRWRLREEDLGISWISCYPWCHLLLKKVVLMQLSSLKVLFLANKPTSAASSVSASLHHFIHYFSTAAELVAVVATDW